MKKIMILLCILGSIWSHADDTIIDRTGWHFGIGVMALGGIIECDVPADECELDDGSLFGVPMLNMVVDYGVTPQFTMSLEHQGYVLVAIFALQGKYYFEEAKESAYVVGGVENVYGMGYDGVDDAGAFKAGVGYAWNHHELEFDIHKNASTLFSLAWRYKF